MSTKERDVSEQAITERMPLPEGAVRATCYVERHANGTWFFYSDEWRGMMLCHHDLGTLLADVPAAGKGLLEAMRDWHSKTPYTGEGQLRQMKIYEDFFAEKEPQRS